jgi:hypothetical protein
MNQAIKQDIYDSSTKQTSQVVLGLAGEKEIEDFLHGDKKAAGKVFARAACYSINGLLPPEPLLSVIKECLSHDLNFDLGEFAL